MKQTVASIAGNTHVLAIGVGRYRVLGPPELEAAGDARDFARALSSTTGGGIPAANIEVLVDGQASSRTVSEALGRLAARATESSRLVVYYSGHGQIRHNEFYFHLFDTEFGADETHALSARSAVAPFAATPANGILFLIDCCDGAGFAETAPEFFSQLGAQDFRIVIAASLKNQEAGQRVGSRSTFTAVLIDVVEGRRACGLRPGELTYLALMEALDFGGAELQRAQSGGDVQQNVAIAGVASGDPLLFVSARQLVRSVTLETDRVSLTRHRYLVASWLLGSALGAMLLLGLFLAWAASHRFVVAESSGTIVNVGYPGVTGFGLPHKLQTLPYTINELVGGNSLSAGKPYLLSPDDVPLEAVRRFVNPAQLAAESLEVGNREEARRIVDTSIKHGVAGLTDFQGLMLQSIHYRLASASQLALIRRGLRMDSLEYRQAAITALLEVNREEALAVLTKDLDSGARRFEHPQALTALMGPCSEGARSYLRSVVHSAEYPGTHPHVALAWLRLACIPEPSDLRAIVSKVWDTEFERVGVWISLMGSQWASEVASDTQIPEWQRVGLLIGAADVPCEPTLFNAIDTGNPVQAALALRYINTHCPNVKIDWEVGYDGRTLHASALVQRRRISLDLQTLGTSESELSRAFVILMPLMQAQNDRSLSPYLLNQVLVGDESLVSPTALIALRWIRAPWQPGQAYYRSGNRQAHALLYYLWQFDTQPEATTRTVMRRLGNPLTQFSPYFAAVVQPKQKALAEVRELAFGAPGSKSDAAAQWIAMQGTAHDMTDLLESDNPEHRRALLDYASYNPNTLAWIATFENPTIDPLLPILARRARYAHQLTGELRSLPAWARCWRLGAEWNRRMAPEPISGAEYLPAGTKALILKLLEANHCTFNYAEEYQ